MYHEYLVVMHGLGLGMLMLSLFVYWQFVTIYPVGFTFIFDMEKVCTHLDNIEVFILLLRRKVGTILRIINVLVPIDVVK